MKVRSEKGTKDIQAVWFTEGKVFMIDQRKLPSELKIVSFSRYQEIAEAIRNMTTRGAPSIGVAACYGICLASLAGEDIEKAAVYLKAARPTANDLFFAVDYMIKMLKEGEDPILSSIHYAESIICRCKLIGEYGARLIKDGYRVMTHCNAGALATVDYGTALAPIRTAWYEGRRFFVYVSETRPRLQGMRLTAWELNQEGIDHAIIPDGASGHFIREGIDLIIVGADRIAANGDFANKIGTFEKAILAREFHVPFYVAAPISSFDFQTKTGRDIIIENRSEEEVTMIGQTRLAPSGSPALNPAFDMTPGEYVTGYITEKGILTRDSLERVLEND